MLQSSITAHKVHLASTRISAQVIVGAGRRRTLASMRFPFEDGGEVPNLVDRLGPTPDVEGKASLRR
jgi:hypothetical protein